jgi:uncharacterized membrane protein YkoI
MINSNVNVDVRGSIMQDVKIAQDNHVRITDYVIRRTRLVFKNCYRNKADAEWKYNVRVMMQKNDGGMGAGGWRDNRSAFISFENAEDIFETFPHLSEQHQEAIRALAPGDNNALFPKVEGQKNRFTSIASDDYKSCVLAVTKVPMSEQYSLPKHLNGNNLEDKGLAQLSQSRDKGYEIDADTGEILFENVKIKPVEDLFDKLEKLTTPKQWLAVILDTRADSAYISKEEALTQMKADFNRRSNVVS